MKGTTIKKFPIFSLICALMAAIFVGLELTPAVSAWNILAGSNKEQTKYIMEFESTNPVEYYEMENGDSYKDLNLPEKVRAVVELPQDIQLSTFKEAQVPEQKDDLLPKYEYSHTVDKLMLETENETSSTDNTSSEEETVSSSAGQETSSQNTEVVSFQGEETSPEETMKTVTEEEAQQLLEESSKISYNSAKVYSFIDSTGKTQYRVYGSVSEQEPCWWAVDEEGTVLGIVEELDANWDFSKLDSTVAGKYQVKVQLPDNYLLNQGVEIAYMQIMVAQENGEQVSSDNKDGNLPSVLPVSYIAARSAANNTQTSSYPVTIEKEGSITPETSSFSGGEITSTSVPKVNNYLFIEEVGSDGVVTSNGASLRVTVDGTVLSYNNVTAIYPVTQDDGTTTWFYTTTLSDGKVAWKVPEGAQLVFRYQPDPNAQNIFTRVTIASEDWKDGSATGSYEEGQQNYTALVPIGEEVSITVDLPSLYTAYKDNIRYTNISASDITETNTKMQLNAEWGPSNLRSKWVNDTVTFKFTVPQLDEAQASTGVRIDLKFLSYMREYYNGQNDTNKQSTNETLWLRINQDYPTLSPYPGNGTGSEEWKGQRAIRVFERPGRVEFKYTDNTNIQYETNSESGIYLTTSKTAYQNLGPEALTSDMNVANSNWVNTYDYGSTPSKSVQTYWSTTDGNDGPNSMQNGAYAMQVLDLGTTGAEAKRSSKEIAADSNDERTLFFVYQNTLRNMGPTYDGTWNPMSMSGQDLPIGVMLYTQNHDTGIFVPLEAKLSMTDPNATGSHEIMADVKIAGMNITITRESYAVEDYTTGMNTSYWPGRGTAKVRKWVYTIQVQGATGYLGADFITSVDTQNNVSLMSVSSNIEKVELLATQGGAPIGNPLVWQTVDSGKSMYVYQLGNSSGGAGQDSSTFDDFYDGVWGTSYSNREGALPIRIKQKDGYGIPYLRFVDGSVSDPKKLIAGITDTNIDSSTGSSKLTTTQINNQSNKTVRGRIQNLNGNTSSTLDGEVVEYLFGYIENGSWQGWGKVTKFTIEADAKVLVVTYDLNGGTATGDIATTTTTWGSGYYVTTPTSTPTAPEGSGNFVGWRIKLADGSYLKNTDGNDIYVQPNQTISTMDNTYFPEDRLAVGHGADYNNTGYFNAAVATLEATYSNNISQGQMVAGSITYYVQDNVDVDTQASQSSSSQSYRSIKQEQSTAPYGQQYYVIRDGDTYTDDSGEYIFNNSLSIYDGTAEYNEENKIVLGDFRYDKVINVSYNVDTEGKPNSVTVPTDDKQYTTVKDHQNTITPKTPDGLTGDTQNTFQGWMVDGDNVTLPTAVTTINLDYHSAPDTTTINGAEAHLSKSVIQSIYNSGTVTLKAVWNSGFDRIESIGGSTWNSQYKSEDYRYIHTQNDGQNLQLKANFSYDTRTQELIQNYWDNRTDTPTTDDGMGKYMNWVLYGYNVTSQQRSTWVIRDQNVTGGSDNVKRIDGVTVDLNLGDDNSDGTADNNRGVATITITIPNTAATYEDMNQQIFYLFVWNEKSNKATQWKPVTDYKALMHTDSSGAQTPYTTILKPIFDSGSGFHNALSGNSNNMSGKGVVSNAYWYTNVVPRKITQVENNSTDDKKQTVVLDNAQTTYKIQATFKYDNSIPWNVQNVNTASSRYAARIGLYRLDYNGVPDTEWINLKALNGDGSFGSSQHPNYEINIIDVNTTEGLFTVEVTINNSEITANYDNYGSKYKIIAYNYDNYTGTIGSLFTGTATNAVQQGGLSSEIGTNIPSNTVTVTFKPKPMESVGNADHAGDITGGNIGHHAFTTSKKTGEKSTITYHFQMDNVSWINNSGQVNTEMQKMFDPQSPGGNVIVTLWKRDSGTGNFTFVDSYNGGISTVLGDTEDGIVAVTAIDHNGNTELEVQVQSGTGSNLDGTQYRVFAWYESSNTQNWSMANIENEAFAAETPNNTVEGVVPYSTATINMNFESPEYYIQYPSLITLYDDQGKVKVNNGSGETDLSDQYAGASAEVTYKASDTGDIPDPALGSVPEIEVDITDNMPMTLAETNTLSTRHTVGVYFQDGYKNNVEGNNTGMVSLGTLSSTRNEPADSSTQTAPVGTSLPFYLNTLQGYSGEKYTALLTFHFNIINTTP